MNYELILFKKFINNEDKILIIDDFLVNGEVVLGVVRLVEEVGVSVVGIGIVIEKLF